MSSVILVMLFAINCQIVPSVRCVVVKAVAGGLAEAEEVVVNAVEKVVVEDNSYHRHQPKQNKPAMTAEVDYGEWSFMLATPSDTKSPSAFSV